MMDVHAQIKESSQEVDAMINVVSLPQLKDKLMIGDDGIFERWEEVRNNEI
jgi:hypothetical protein